MKKSSIVLLLLAMAAGAQAQHYGGLMVAPYASHNSVYAPEKGLGVSPLFSPGFSIGYQGVLMADRRFSFSYGLDYSYQHAKTHYNPNKYFINNTGEERSLQSLEIPLALRYNVIKNSKWQPYLSLSFVPFIALDHHAYWYDDEQNKHPRDWSGTGMQQWMYMGLGAGASYRTGPWQFNLEFTGHYGYIEKYGLQISLLRKF